METLRKLNGRLEEFGDGMARQWLDLPSSKDPTRTNFEVCFKEVLEDIQAGRLLSEPYPPWQPLRESVRRGIITSMVNWTISKESSA